MCQCVFFSEQSPNSVFEVGIAVVELNSLQFCKLFNQGLINDKVLLAILSRGLVLMLTNTLFQKLCHLEVRITEQSRNTHNRSHHLSIKGTTTITNQKVWLLTVNESTNKTDSLFWVHRQIWCDNISSTLESLFQCNSWYAPTTGIETVKEQNLLHPNSSLSCDSPFCSTA